MGCPENITSQTKEQLSANGRKGGLKSAEVKKKKRAAREELMLILSLPVKRSIKNAANKMLSVDKAKALADFAGRNTTVQTQILLQLNKMAMSGNLKAIQFIFELTGEMNQKEVTINIDDSMKNYYDQLSNQLKSRQIEGVDDDED